MMYKLGIDVGGTNTDAVLVDENRKVVADIKYPTSVDIYDGILGAMRTVLEVSGVDPKQIHQAMLGTTQCTNAIVERKHLAPIGILRIGAPATTGIRPMVDWAEDIQKVAVTIGGVRTNFRMPDVISIGLGGGSIVRARLDGSVTVGSDSVGYELTEKAMVFGGSVILPEKIHGAASVLKPGHFGCANAIGSAISKVSGTYEKLMNYDEPPREQSLEKAKQEAVELAVNAGAVRETVEIIEMEDVPLAYYPGNTNRVKIKAAGDLS